MVHMQEVAEKNTVPEFRSQTEFQGIASANNLTKEQATDFWDWVFTEKTALPDVNNIDEDSLFAEVFGGFEDEFDFDFEIDEDMLSVLDKFDSDRWEKLSDDERETVVGELAAAIAKKLGLSEPPEIQFFGGSENHCGAFNSRDNTIEINKTNFSDPEETIDTVAHEMRHAYQFERSEKQETYTDMLYKYNFDNYISPDMIDGYYISFLDYQDQFIEAEARAFANLFTSKETSL